MLPKSIIRRWNVHESTQRSLVRLAFLCLGFLPTLLCLGWLCIACTPLPSYWLRRQAEQIASERLGLKVEIGAARQTAPDRLEWRAIRFRHPETGLEIATADRIHWTYKEGVWWGEITEATLQSEQAVFAWRALHDWFICRPAEEKCTLRLVLPTLQIQYPQGNYTLTDVLAVAKPSQTDFQGAFSYQQANEASGANTVWTLVRKHDDVVPTSKIHLATHQTSLPCDLWSLWWPSLQILGQSARFKGEMTLEYHEGSLLAFESAGELRGVDLGVMSSVLPAQIQGQADIQLEYASMRQGRLERIRGSLIGQSGVMEKSLLLHTGLNLATRGYPEKIRLMNPLVHYDQLGLQFEMDASGLLLKGGVLQPEHPEGERVLVASHQESILYHPETVIPLENVARWLHGDSLVSPNTVTGKLIRSWLVNHLPQAISNPTRLSSIPGSRSP